jgi:hypothetical protein
MTKSTLGRTLRLTLVIVLGAAVSSCASTVFDKRACPVERKYSKAEQDQFLRDLDRTPTSIQGAMVDYGKLRDKARACRGVK